MSYSPVPNNFGHSPRLTRDDELHNSNPSLSHGFKEDIELAPVSLAHTSSVSHSYYSEPIKSSAVHLTRAHEAKQSTSHGRLRVIVRNIWLTTWLPFIAFAYLSFCYVVATRVVPVEIYRVGQPANHLYGIKAGVTTLSIITITIALLPIKSLIDDLKSEEFFRKLHKTKEGVPISRVNDVSTPSHGLFRGIVSIIRAQSTKYYTGAVLSALVAAAVSSLAPAALSVAVISVDGEISAFRVGGVARDSMYKSDFNSAYPNNVFTERATEAAAMAWVQTTLGMDMTFKPTSPNYAVPVPLDLDPSTRARWATDVIVMNPVCRWAVPDPPVVIPTTANANNSFYTNVDFLLPAYGIGVNVTVEDLAAGRKGKTIQVMGGDSFLGTYNLTNKDPPTEGIMAWLVVQCTNCQDKLFGDRSMIDFTGIPTQQVTTPVTSGTETDVFSVLVCDPGATIETREVRMDGGGRIDVMENRSLLRQGNLHTAQTKLLLAKSLSKYTSDSGPTTPYQGIGTAAQIQLFFGKIGNANETSMLTPRPIEKLSEAYGLAQQASMRSYLSGSMATAYVPGRHQTMTLVFTSSLPHVIVSTILFAFLALFINACYLRSDSEQFTLFSVAAALAHSNVPAVCNDIKYADSGRGAVREVVALESLEGRRIRLGSNGGAGQSLFLE